MGVYSVETFFTKKGEESLALFSQESEGGFRSPGSSGEAGWATESVGCSAGTD